jgi:outer membrane protein assembly factor BamB
MPGPLAAAGRLFVQGLNRILAMDSYNGTILWSREVPGMIRMNVPRDSSNWCTDGDHVYLAVRGECWQIAAANGQVVRKYPALAGANSNWKYDWSYVASDGPLLLGSAVKQGTAYTDFWGGSNWYDQPQGPETFKVCSDNLFALNKKTGETAWRYANGLIVNPTITIGPGAVYFIECRHPAVAAADTRRVGAAELWQQQFMVALEVSTGKKLWERQIDTHDGIAVFYLAYGEGKLVLVSSGSGAFHVYAFHAENGSPAWDQRFGWPNGKADHGLAMSRPAVVGNKLFVRPMTFELATGKPLPQLIPGGGCGTYACAAGSLLFRAGHVTMWDAHSGNTSIWQRLRPGCWLSTIPADGLILSPEAGGGCSCGQWLETSIALVPRSYYPRPRIIAAGEVFEGSIEVKLECSNPDGVIRYTLDGKEPTANSAVYEKPLKLENAAVLTARFFHRDGNHGLTASRSFRKGMGDVTNLAPQAIATATSEWNATYAAKMATDGIVVPRGSRNDAGKAWSVFGPTAGGKGEFTLTWKEPVEIGEIIYFGRTAFGPEDNFKDVEIYLDDAQQPIRRATLEKIHGPQRLAIPTTKAKVLKLKFLNCHGGGNPGASEIMVFSKTPADALLPK